MDGGFAWRRSAAARKRWRPLPPARLNLLPGRSRRRQRNCQRVAAQHHERNQPPNRPFAVRVGAKELGDVSDRRRFRLDPATGRDQAGTFSFQIGKRHALTLPLVMSGTGVSRGVRVSAHRCRF